MFGLFYNISRLMVSRNQSKHSLEILFMKLMVYFHFARLLLVMILFHFTDKEWMIDSYVILFPKLVSISFDA